MHCSVLCMCYVWSWDFGSGHTANLWMIIAACWSDSKTRTWAIASVGWWSQNLNSIVRYPPLDSASPRFAGKDVCLGVAFVIIIINIIISSVICSIIIIICITIIVIIKALQTPALVGSGQPCAGRSSCRKARASKPMFEGPSKDLDSGASGWIKSWVEYTIY